MSRRWRWLVFGLNLFAILWAFPPPAAHWIGHVAIGVGSWPGRWMDMEGEGD